MTEEEDKKAEEKHIVEALEKCGYPRWTFKKVKSQMKDKKEKKTDRRNKSKDKSKGLVILPYVQGLTEGVSRVLRKHQIASAIRPLKTIRNYLVHPKDKQETLEKSEVVYKIPCKNCNQVYIGETGRKFGTRLKEHEKDVENNKKGQFTRTKRKESLQELNKSAITDHANQNNHEIDWEGARVIDRESDYKTRTIKEAMHIRVNGQVMNRDEGGYQLSRVYDQVFATTTESGGNLRR